MKIMLITPFYLPSVGGVQFILYNVCKRLAPDDIVVMRSRDPLDDNITQSFNDTQRYKIIENKFYTPSPNPLSDLNVADRKKFTQKTVWNRSFLKSRIVRLGYIFLSILSTLSAIKRNKIDVLWCGYLNTRFMVAGVLSRYILRIPYFIHTYGEELPGLSQGSSMINFMVNRIRIIGLKKSFGIFTLSSFSKDCLMKTGLPGDKIILKNPCVDINNFEESLVMVEQLREKYGLKERKILLSVGNITERKGIDIILKLIPALIQYVPNLIYMVVGKFIGEEETKLKRIISEYNIEDKVIFVGEISHDNIAPYFHLCDVFCLATRENQEGFGMVFIEANACKKPVVGMDTGGVRDAIVHGETGLLVEMEDKEGFKNALLKILTDDKYAKELGTKGYERVLKEFSWDRYAKEVYTTFEKAFREKNEQEG